MLAPMTSALDAETIAGRIRRAEGLVPEQIQSPADSDSPAILVDQWGRVHALCTVTVLGREPGDANIAVLSSSVSRRHASLRYDAADDSWTIEDLGSTNGTFVEGKRVEAPVRLRDDQLIGVGDVVFAFLVDGTAVACAIPTESIRATAASESAASGLRLVGAESGGGLAEWRGQSIQLSSTQFALLSLLAARYRADADRADELRGFVRTIELLTELPWDTAHPTDNHLKQLIRRVRRALGRLGIDEPIESRHGFGYRVQIDVSED
jgi:hypothetical protein